MSQIKVVGAAAVLRTASGADKYLYKSAVVAAAEFSEASVEHVLAVGLVERVKPVQSAAARAKSAADAKAKADAQAKADAKSAEDAAAADAAAIAKAKAAAK